MNLAVNQLKITSGLDKVFEHSQSQDDMELKNIARLLRNELNRIEQELSNNLKFKISGDVRLRIDNNVTKYWKLAQDKKIIDDKIKRETKTFWIGLFVKVFLGILTFFAATDVVPKITKQYYDVKPVKEKLESKVVELSEMKERLEFADQSILKLTDFVNKNSSHSNPYSGLEKAGSKLPIVDDKVLEDKKPKSELNYKYLDK